MLTGLVPGLVCWRQLGDLVSATTALGLHRQTDRRITFLSEFKKYIFAIIFGIDSKAYHHFPLSLG